MNVFARLFSRSPDFKASGASSSPSTESPKSDPLNVVLIDFENVQPQDLGMLEDGNFQVKLFLGPHQARRISTPIATALQPLGRSVEYIPLETSGKNNLDFHIACYIGRLSMEHSDAFYHVITNDTDLDGLIEHLRSRKIRIQRSGCIADIPYFRRQLAKFETHTKLVLEDLIRRKDSKPRTQQTLLNTLNAIFRNQLSGEQVSQLFQLLCRQGYIKLDGTRVIYDLPAEC